MKILAIMGSPRKKKMTYTFTKKFEEIIQTIEPVDFEYLYLIDYDLKMCAGCYNCLMKDEKLCKDAETMEKIVDKMKNADGIIFVSPSFVDNVSGLMKNFIDHCSYLIHRPPFTDKYAITISVTLGSGHKETANYLAQTAAKMGFSVENINPIVLSTFDDTKELPKIKKNCIAFLNAIKQKAPARPTFNQVLYFKILQVMGEVQKSQGWGLDYDFWAKNGWYSAPYYREAKIGFFTNLFSNFIRNMIKSSIAKSFKDAQKKQRHHYNLDVI
jgi:multimeric flavodoxin WrbA